MRWDITHKIERKKEKRKKEKEYYENWHRIFLFFPKKIDNKWVWLEFVERKFVFPPFPIDSSDIFFWGTEKFKLPEKANND